MWGRDRSDTMTAATTSGGAMGERHVILGEAVSIDSNVVIALLIVLALLAALGIAIVWLGCVLARRGGAGNQRALVGWSAILVLEFSPLIITQDLTTLVFPIAPVVALQVWFHFLGRREARDDRRGPES